MFWLKKMELFAISIVKNTLSSSEGSKDETRYLGSNLFISEESAAFYSDNLLPSKQSKQIDTSFILSYFKNTVVLLIVLMIGLMLFAFIPRNYFSSLEINNVHPVTKVDRENTSSSKELQIATKEVSIEKEIVQYTPPVSKELEMEDYYNYNNEKIVIDIQPK